MNPLQWSRKGWIGFLVVSVFAALLWAIAAEEDAEQLAVGFAGGAISYWFGGAMSRRWSQEQRTVWFILAAIGGLIGWAIQSFDGDRFGWFIFGAGVAALGYYAWRISHLSTAK